MVVVTSYWFLLLTLLSALFSNGESLSFFLSFFFVVIFFVFPIFVSEAGIHPAGTISIHLVKMVSINHMPVHQECELPKS